MCMCIILVSCAALLHSFCVTAILDNTYTFSASSEEPRKQCTSIAELYGSLSCCALPAQLSVATARGIVNHLSTSSVSQPIQ